MRADFTDPDWAYLWPAAALVAAALLVLLVLSLLRLNRAARRLRALEQEAE